MKDELFEPYYKLGFDHFIFTELLHLKKPKTNVQLFYLALITLILSISIIAA